MSALAAVELRGVSLMRGGRSLLMGIDLTVPQGATCAVIGPNGCGKSTLLRAIQGFEFPTSGAIDVLGQRLGETNLGQLRRRVRLVGSAGALDFGGDMTLADVVSTGQAGTLGLYGPAPGAAAALRAMRGVGLAQRGGVRWAHASAGERTRALLARARLGGVGGGRLLLLDEPTANLDPAAREDVVAMLARPEKGVTQVIVTHHVEELPATTSVALVLRAGRVVAAGEAGRVLVSAVLSRAFGVPMAVTRRGGRWRARVK